MMTMEHSTMMRILTIGIKYMPWICPKCSAAIEELRYCVPITDIEYGTAFLPADGDIDDDCEVSDHEFSDTAGSNWDGDCDYECPECDRTVILSEVVWKAEAEDEEEKKDPITKKKVENMEETNHAIIRPLDDIIETDMPKITDSSICCKTCRHIMIIAGSDDSCYGEYFCECPQCNEVNSLIEYQSLVKSGFYNKNPNDYAKHKK